MRLSKAEVAPNMSSWKRPSFWKKIDRSLICRDKFWWEKISKSHDCVSPLFSNFILENEFYLKNESRKQCFIQCFQNIVTRILRSWAWLLISKKNEIETIFLFLTDLDRRPISYFKCLQTGRCIFFAQASNCLKDGHQRVDNIVSHPHVAADIEMSFLFDDVLE